LREVDITESGGGMEHVITQGSGADRQPVYARDGNILLFSSNRSGNTDLWQVDRRNGALHQITDDPADDWDPGISPDGKSILWSSNRGGNMEIWMANRDGSGARQVTRDKVDAENPTMTPDGKWVVYGSSNNADPGIWKIRPDGTDATRIASGSMLLPEVSPDGRYAMYSLVRSLDVVIQVVEVETGEVIPFEVQLDIDVRQQNVVFGRGRWMPDGRHIVYVGQDDEGQSGVYMQEFDRDRDTSRTRRPVAGFSHSYVTESLGVSPDGTRLTLSVQSARRSITLADNVWLRDWR
jgi:Tol biopolymer transport system component